MIIIPIVVLAAIVIGFLIILKLKTKRCSVCNKLIPPWEEKFIYDGNCKCILCVESNFKLYSKDMDIPENLIQKEDVFYATFRSKDD